MWGTYCGTDAGMNAQCFKVVAEVVAMYYLLMLASCMHGYWLNYRMGRKFYMELKFAVASRAVKPF